MKYFHVDIDEAIDFDKLATFGELFEMARLKVHHEGLSALDEKDFKEFITRLAAYCCDMGIPEEYAIYEARSVYWRRSQEVVMSFHNYYADHKRTYASCRTMNKEQRIQFWLDVFLKRTYKLRYNVMTREAEYADRTVTQPDFRPVTDRILYQMVERANKEGIGVWEKTLKHRLESGSV